jgi:hypothetical protein
MISISESLLAMDLQQQGQPKQQHEKPCTHGSTRLDLSDAMEQEHAREEAAVLKAIQADLDADKENRDPYLSELAEGGRPPPPRGSSNSASSMLLASTTATTKNQGNKPKTARKGTGTKTNRKRSSLTARARRASKENKENKENHLPSHMQPSSRVMNPQSSLLAVAPKAKQGLTMRDANVANMMSRPLDSSRSRIVKPSPSLSNRAADPQDSTRSAIEVS